MRTVTQYEWAREVLTAYKANQTPLGEDGYDIEDSYFGDKLADTPSHAEVMSWNEYDDSQLALMRNVHCAETGNLEDRQYAYVIDGVLTEFDGGAKVPKKYRQELIKSGLKK